MSKPDEVTTLMGVGPGRCGHGLPRRPTRRSSKNFYKVKFTASCESAADRPDGPGFSGSCTATSHNPLIQRGATTATKSEPFRPQRGAPGSIVKDLPLRREAACYRELPRILLPRTPVNKGEVGDSGPLSPAPTYTLPQQERHQEGNDDERNPDCTPPRPRARRHSLTLCDRGFLPSVSIRVGVFGPIPQ